MEMGNVAIDLIQNGNGTSPVANQILNMDYHQKRPFVDLSTGKAYVNQMQANGEMGVAEIPPGLQLHANTLLTKDEWIELDKAMLQAAKPRLKLVGDLQSRGLTRRIPNGMSATVFQTQRMADITEAEISMDGLRRSEGDRPEADLVNLPLPIVSKDFSFTKREVLGSRRDGNLIDIATGQLAARRVAEVVETLATGTYGSYSFGGGTIYGLTNFPSRNTYTITDWDGSSATGETIIADVIGMKAAARADNHYGPYVLYVSDNYNSAIEADYKAASDKTTRQRILELEDIEAVTTLDYLAANTVVLVEMDPMTIRMIDGMNISVVQWETEGGMRWNYKVMAIMVPQLRADIAGKCGIVHGSPA